MSHLTRKSNLRIANEVHHTRLLVLIVKIDVVKIFQLFL